VSAADLTRDGRSRPTRHRRSIVAACRAPTFRTGRMSGAHVCRRWLVLAVASATFLVGSCASGYAKGAPPSATSVTHSGSGGLPSKSTADFVVTPLVNPNTREFVASRSDFSRSFLLARIVIPLLLVLLIERELLIAGGRMGARAFLAYGLPLMAISALLAYARIRTYVD